MGGAPVTTALLDRIRAKLPRLRERGLANTWGMTESGGFLTVAVGPELARYPGTVGRPYPVVELKIDCPDEDGVGEILARSPSVMIGYVGIDDGTIDSDGWLHTGDLGHINEEGYLFIDGRSKDVVIRGGENIACPHVEAALASHPAVVEVAADRTSPPRPGRGIGGRRRAQSRDDCADRRGTPYAPGRCRGLLRDSDALADPDRSPSHAPRREGRQEATHRRVPTVAGLGD